VVGEKGRRVYAPAGEKDVSDAARAGADLRRWALALMHLDALDAGAGLTVLELERECERLLADIERNAGREPRHSELCAELHAAMTEHQRTLELRVSK